MKKYRHSPDHAGQRTKLPWAKGLLTPDVLAGVADLLLPKCPAEDRAATLSALIDRIAAALPRLARARESATKLLQSKR